MSHISRLKTQMVEKEYLLQALKDLSYNYEEGDVQVRSFGGRMTHVDIKVKIPLSYDIGFHKNAGGTYDIVADWYGVRGVKEKAFAEKVMQRYAYHAARAKLEEQGFTLVEEQQGKSGQIRMVLRRAV